MNNHKSLTCFILVGEQYDPAAFRVIMSNRARCSKDAGQTFVVALPPLNAATTREPDVDEADRSRMVGPAKVRTLVTPAPAPPTPRPPLPLPALTYQRSLSAPALLNSEPMAKAVQRGAEGLPCLRQGPNVLE